MSKLTKKDMNWVLHVDLLVQWILRTTIYGNYACAYVLS